jgi:hypothetical protein
MRQTKWRQNKAKLKCNKDEIWIDENKNKNDKHDLKQNKNILQNKTNETKQNKMKRNVTKWNETKQNETREN